ncbi:hypothetical protein P3T24_004380 [Paraburkholderia sp. GAS33]|uniref:hypothetical protein n=1 Tax=Paraburkholderia sp. GAS33 TaxID=3035130 RepID=UPI003D19F1C7
MSEKVIDPLSLLSQVRKDADPRDRRLFEMRLAEEFEAERNEARWANAVERSQVRPAVPQAQLVYDASNDTAGVAIEGARFVCPLPKGYGGPGCELAVIDRDRLIVLQPGKPELLIDPETGKTRRL